MNVLFQAHSGLRFLILLAGAVALVTYLVGQVRGQPFGKGHRIVGAAYAGLLHFQALLGLGVAFSRFYPALIGHMVMMVTAAVVMQACLTINRKRPLPTMRLPLIGAAVSMALIIGGIFAVPGRGLFTMTAM